MSLSNTTVGQTYACNGATTTFAIPFGWNSTSEIKVYLTLLSTKVETLLVQTTHYTFSPNDTAPTSIVTLTAYSNLYTIRIERGTSIQQVVTYLNNSGFLAQDHEKALDKIVQMVQELSLRVDNTVRLSRPNYGGATVLGPNLTPGLALVVNPAGTGIEQGAAIPDISAIAASIAAANAAAAAAAAQVVLAQAAAALAATYAASLGQQTYGSPASPLLISAGTGINQAIDTRKFIVMYIAGNGAPVNISANPQIIAGQLPEQELILICTSAANTVTINDGNGVVPNGACTLGYYNIIKFIWSNSTWVEQTRSN